MHVHFAVVSSLIVFAACSGDGEPSPDQESGIPGAETGTPPAPLGFGVAVDTGVVRIVRSRAVRVPVTIDRTDGYTGPVNVTVDGLPLEVTALPLTIGGGETMGELELSAAVGAALGGPTVVTVEGTPEVGEPVASEPLPLFVAGQSGTLDPTFSFDGKLIYDVDPDNGGASNGLTVDSEGRVIAVGTTGGSSAAGVALRLSIDGTVDTSFGAEGLVRLGGDFSLVEDVVVRPGDEPLLLTFRDPGGLRSIEAFDAAGQSEVTWAAKGVRTVVTEDFLAWVGLRPRADGGTYVVGNDELIALDAAGSPVAGFSYALTNLEGHGASAVDSDGRLLLGGTSSGLAPFRVERRLPDGSLDPSFGDGGLLEVTPLTGNFHDVNGLAATADGGGVGVGSSSLGLEPLSTVLFRFDADGELDPGFGDGGLVALASGEADFQLVAVQASGRILVAGGSNGDAQIRRFNPDGSPDITFGLAGEAPLDALPRALTLEPAAGRIVVLVDDQTVDGFEIVRLWQ